MGCRENQLFVLFIGSMPEGGGHGGRDKEESWDGEEV